MTWTFRQRAMLQEMGLRVWLQAPTSGVEVGRSEPSSGVAAATPELFDAQAAGPERAALAGTARAAAATQPNPADDERLQAIAAMDWPELRDAVGSCTACGLCGSRTQTVFGTGNPRAQWMIVGEAPGEQEDLRGEPFVGKSGQLLDNMLRAVHLTREKDKPARQVYIANTLKCRPPGNRNPNPDELAQCEPFLIRQIQLIQPDVILAMGRFAVQALLRSNEPVGRLRGRVHRYHGVALIVTYHPAYLLRNPLDKARAWNDLCLALDAARKLERP